MAKEETPKKKAKKPAEKKPAEKKPAKAKKIVSEVEVKTETPEVQPELPEMPEEFAGYDAKDKKPAALRGEPRPDDKAGRDRYFEAVGRRKTSVARVRVYTRAGDFTVNEKPYGNYFSTLDLQRIAEDALQKMKLFGRFRVSAKISGGGVHSQAEALRHGIARALVKFNPDFRKRLKRAGFLTRDPRMKERKKFGLKKARRAPQWAKR